MNPTFQRPHNQLIIKPTRTNNLIRRFQKDRLPCTCMIQYPSTSDYERLNRKTIKNGNDHADHEPFTPLTGRISVQTTVQSIPTAARMSFKPPSSGQTAKDAQP